MALKTLKMVFSEIIRSNVAHNKDAIKFGEHIKFVIMSLRGKIVSMIKPSTQRTI